LTIREQPPEWVAFEKNEEVRIIDDDLFEALVKRYDRR
jgi:hypothetical protein